MSILYYFYHKINYYLHKERNKNKKRDENENNYFEKLL